MDASALAERDRLGCLQAAGPRGPPFTAGLAAAGPLSRWLPWRWFSLDGTGWCYDAGWDELERCADMDVPVDWNGVSRQEPRALWLSALLPLCALVFTLCSLGCAFSAWVDRRKAAGGHTDAPPPTLREWIASRHALLSQSGASSKARCKCRTA